MKSLLIGLFCLFTINVFAQTSENTTTDSSKYATLYVYRPKNYEGSMIGYNIKVNEQVVGRIKNNSKFEVKLYKEGPAEIAAETEQQRKVKINVEFGKSYYLKCGVTTGIWVGRPEINLVYPEQGKMDYENLEAKKSRKNER